MMKFGGYGRMGGESLRNRALIRIFYIVPHRWYIRLICLMLRLRLTLCINNTDRGSYFRNPHLYLPYFHSHKKFVPR